MPSVETRAKGNDNPVVLGFRPVRTPNAINVGLPVLLGDLIPGTDWDNNPSVVVSPYREVRPDWSHPNKRESTKILVPAAPVQRLLINHFKQTI